MSAHPDLFADIDSMEPDAFAQHLADDVSFIFGNAEPVIGRDAVRDTWAGFCDGIAGVRHDVIEQWENGAADDRRVDRDLHAQGRQHDLAPRGHDLPRRGRADRGLPDLHGRRAAVR